MTTRPPLRLAAALLASMLLASCGLLQAPPDPDPAAQGMADDTAPIGPVVEVGRGETVNGEFRYLVWESRMGTCTKVEYVDGDGPISCGGSLLDQAGEAVSLSSFGGGTGGWDVQGLAGDEVAQLWLDTANGVRVPVVLMSLAPAGMDGRVFYTAVREETRPTRLVGLDADGQIIAEVTIDAP